MILFMFVALGQGQITQMTKFLSYYRAFVTSIIFVTSHHDTPNSKGTRGQKTFGTLGAGADNSNRVNF